MTVPGGTFVDTNILLDVLVDNPTWGPWSSHQLSVAIEAGEVVLNPVVYAELAAGFERIEDLEAALPAWIKREEVPWQAAFLAGRLFRQHLDRGGTRRSPLPDFFIAAHAAVSGRALLTRDRAEHQTLLPSLRVISPDTTG